MILNYTWKNLKKRGTQMKNRDKEYKFADLNTSKNNILEKLKNAKFHDLEDLVY